MHIRVELLSKWSREEIKRESEEGTVFASLYCGKKSIKTQQGMKKCDWFIHDVILYIETIASLASLHRCQRKGGKAFIHAVRFLRL